METETGLGVAWGCGKQEENRQRPPAGDEKALKSIVVMGTRLGECTKSHCPGGFKRVKYVLYELELSKAVILKFY